MLCPMTNLAFAAAYWNSSRPNRARTSVSKTLIASSPGTAQQRRSRLPCPHSRENRVGRPDCADGRRLRESAVIPIAIPKYL